MGGLVLNSKEICAILEASKGTGIKEIKVKDLTLKFHDLTDENKAYNNSTNAVLFNNHVPQVEGDEINSVEDVNIYGELEKKADDSELKDEVVMAHLMANDPEAYEKYQKEL